MCCADVCVPVSKLADCLNETEKDIARTGIFAPMVSHAGDGNFHLFVLFDPDDKVQMQKALDLNDRLGMLNTSRFALFLTRFNSYESYCDARNVYR